MLITQGRVLCFETTTIHQGFFAALAFKLVALVWNWKDALCAHAACRSHRL